MMRPAPSVETPASPQEPDRSRRGWLARVALAVAVGWLLLALAFWALLLGNQAESGQALDYQFFYYYLMFGLVGLPLWFARRRVAAALQAWRVAGFAKFLLLGYGMVLLEETFAALVNHLTEGFAPGLLLLRIGQFWALNVLAFTGLIVGGDVLVRLFPFGRREAFFLVGVFGLYAERTLTLLPGNVLAFFLFAPLNLFVYGLILSPALLSVPAPSVPARRWSWLVRYPVALALPLLLSIPPVLLLTALRARFPEAFPPCGMISC